MTKEEYREHTKHELIKINKRLYKNACRLIRQKIDLKEQIADIKANCDLAIEGRDVKIMELMEEKAEMLDILKEVETLMKMWLSDEPFTITQHKGLIADTEQLVEKIGEKVK